MTARLVPCHGCQRHVRVTEGSCPFCQAALATVADPDPRAAPAALRRGRLFSQGTRNVALAGVAIGSSLWAVACNDQVAVLYGLPCDDACTGYYDAGEELVFADVQVGTDAPAEVGGDATPGEAGDAASPAESSTPEGGVAPESGSSDAPSESGTAG